MSDPAIPHSVWGSPVTPKYMGEPEKKNLAPGQSPLAGRFTPADQMNKPFQKRCLVIRALATVAIAAAVTVALVATKGIAGAAILGAIGTTGVKAAAVAGGGALVGFALKSCRQIRQGVTWPVDRIRTSLFKRKQNLSDQQSKLKLIIENTPENPTTHQANVAESARSLVPLCNPGQELQSGTVDTYCNKVLKREGVETHNYTRSKGSKVKPLEVKKDGKDVVFFTTKGRLGSAHIMSVVVDHKAKRVEFYDSRGLLIQDRLSSKVPYTGESFSKFMQDLLPADQFFAEDGSGYSLWENTEKQQVDVHNCGVMVLKWTTERLAVDDPSTIKLDSRKAITYREDLLTNLKLDEMLNEPSYLGIKEETEKAVRELKVGARVDALVLQNLAAVGRKVVKQGQEAQKLREKADTSYDSEPLDTSHLGSAPTKQDHPQQAAFKLAKGAIAQAIEVSKKYQVLVTSDPRYEDVRESIQQSVTSLNTLDTQFNATADLTTLVEGIEKELNAIKTVMEAKKAQLEGLKIDIIIEKEWASTDQVKEAWSAYIKAYKKGGGKSNKPIQYEKIVDSLKLTDSSTLKMLKKAYLARETMGSRVAGFNNAVWGSSTLDPKLQIAYSVVHEQFMVNYNQVEELLKRLNNSKLGDQEREEIYQQLFVHLDSAHQNLAKIEKMFTKESAVDTDIADFDAVGDTADVSTVAREPKGFIETFQAYREAYNAAENEVGLDIASYDRDEVLEQPVQRDDSSALKMLKYAYQTIQSMEEALSNFETDLETYHKIKNSLDNARSSLGDLKNQNIENKENIISEIQKSLVHAKTILFG